MGIVYGQRYFWIASGQTIRYDTTFPNGDYLGPVYTGPAPESLGEAIRGSVASTEFTSRDANGYSSRCRYLHEVTNPNPVGGVLFRFHYAHP